MFTVQERALNEKPPAGMTAQDYIIRVIYEELLKILGTLYVIDILLLPKDAIDRGKVNQMRIL